MGSQQLLHDLSFDFASLLNNQKCSDVRITVGNGPNAITFHAHGLVLATRSSYFAAALSSNLVQRENGIILFSEPNISPQIFEVILRYMYSGEIELNKYEVPKILELIVAAEELILEKLINHLEDYLIEHHAKELKENFLTLRETSYKYPSFKKLQDFFTEIAVRNPAAIFNSQDFTSLDQCALVSFLQRDLFDLQEAEIWEKVVEWGAAKLANNIDIKEISNWTDENFEAFNGIIEEFLPFIRFFHISSVDFYYKVKPFEKILPGTLYEDLLHHYLVPGSHQTSVDAQPLRLRTKLLEIHNLKQLLHWIEDKDENTPFQNQLEYKITLLLQGSRDGFTPADFHRLCNDKRATVTVIKVKETGQLIGGYNPVSWHSGGRLSKGDGSFIFSLGNGKAENAKLSKFSVEHGGNYSSKYGPKFGESNLVMGGDDFQNKSGCYCRSDNSYEHAIMPDSEHERVNFSVEEYEVFQIIKL
ncbi:hypothetical protein G9A89_003538 [Geosiphon pyriformis]|nr:hypothetical protein G9A89_003538 [Geosiphon pyriformis]